MTKLKMSKRGQSASKSPDSNTGLDCDREVRELNVVRPFGV